MKSIILSMWLVIGGVVVAFAGTNNLKGDDVVKTPYNGPKNIPDPQVILQGGDTIEDATVIVSLPHHSTGTTVGYTDDYDEVCPYTWSTSPDVVYVWSCPADTCIDVDLCNGSDYDTKLYIYENSYTPGAPFACNDDECPGYVSQLLDLNVNGGNTYYIVIDGYAGDAGNYVLDVTSCTPPSPPPECDYNAPDFQCGQKPYAPDENWVFTASDEENGPYLVFDNYSFTSGGVGMIEFWGVDLYYNLSWSECNEDPTTFNVGFYADIGGMPDYTNPLYMQDVTVGYQVPSGQIFGGVFIENFYSLYLPTAVWFLDGWFSLQGIGNGDSCAFLWSGSPEGDGLSYQEQDGQLIQLDYDMAYCFYDGT